MVREKTTMQHRCCSKFTQMTLFIESLLCILSLTVPELWVIRQALMGSFGIDVVLSGFNELLYQK